MKGQFALFEVFLSSLALSALVSLLACILYTYPSVTGAYNFNYGNLLYDFTNAFYGNSTVSACFASGNYTCESGFIEAFKSVYAMDYVEFSAGNSTVSYGSKILCRRSVRSCFPINKNDSFSIACIYACGA